MGWFRSQVRYGVALALTALALNIAVAFGHHHFEALRDTTTAAGRHTHDDGHDDHTPAAADPCFACIVTAIAAIASAPPHLPPRGATRVAAKPTIVVAEPKGASRRTFEARAPPLA
jgi:hypothetical protein